MKRLVTLTTVCAAFMLLAGPAAAAPRQLPAHGHDLDRAALSARSLAVEQSAGKARYVPLGQRLAASCTVGGVVRDYYGSGIEGAGLEWWAPDGSGGWYTATGTSTTGGAYLLSVAPTSGAGELYAYPNDDTTYGLLGDFWPAGGAVSRDFWPGRVSAIGLRGGPWKDFDDLTLRLWGSTRYSRGYVATADTTTDPATVLVDVLEGSYSVGSLNFFSDEGLEFSGSYGVTSNSLSEATVVGDESDAQRITVTAPYWASGKPGSAIKVLRVSFPAGWVNDVTGYSEYPEVAPVKNFGSRTSTGATNESLGLKVPSTAKVGYWYLIGMQHTNGLQALYLETPFQVCTMKPSKTSIHKGTKICVTGIVPTEYHWGSHAGSKKTATLYAHKGTAAVPTVWNPAKKGWVKVGSVKTNGRGAYKTPHFKPLKTLTLVVRYPEDDWYWGAYTSTKKITVR